MTSTTDQQVSVWRRVDDHHSELIKERTGTIVLSVRVEVARSSTFLVEAQSARDRARISAGVETTGSRGTGAVLLLHQSLIPVRNIRSLIDRDDQQITSSASLQVGKPIGQRRITTLPQGRLLSRCCAADDQAGNGTQKE